jgi:hypothetical protein
VRFPYTSEKRLSGSVSKAVVANDRTGVMAERRQHLDRVADPEHAVGERGERAAGDLLDADAQCAVPGELARRGADRVGAPDFFALAHPADGQVLPGLKRENGSQLGRHRERHRDRVVGEPVDADHLKLVENRTPPRRPRDGDSHGVTSRCSRGEAPP